MAATDNLLPKIPPRSAKDIASACKLSSKAAALLETDLAPLDFLDRLLARDDLTRDALQFLCQALPKQEAVWWGCLCVCLTVDNAPSSPAREALLAAAHWVVRPEEEQRRAAGIAAQAAGIATPAGGVAQAAFHSGGSLSAPNLPKAEPPPTLTGKTLNGALNLAATLPPAQQIPLRYRQFAALGVSIALGKYGWHK